MSKRKYPLSLFIIGFVRNFLVRNFLLFLPGVILLFAGIWVDWCLCASLALLCVDLIVSLVEQMRIRKTMLFPSNNEQFSKFQDAFFADGDVSENLKYFFDNVEKENGSTGEDIQNNLVFSMCNRVCIKCNYGQNIEALNEHERVLYITQILEQEVNNGGFSQFFYNSSGNFSNELVDAFTKIGAIKTAEICKKALSVFNGPVPVDRVRRQILLEELDCDDALDECDAAFYKYEDKLEELNFAYIMEHRDAFD